LAELKASVIIPVYNRVDMVLRCVRFVVSQEIKDIEIIVIDDGSNCNFEEMLKNENRVRLVRHDKRQGPGAARNTGVKESRGDILIFIDSDCWPDSTNWIEQHLSAQNRFKGFLVSGIVLGKHKTYGGASFSYCNWFMFKGRRLDKCGEPHVPMANVSVSRSVFDRIGFFDNTIHVGEDIEWCYRAKLAGVPIRVIDDAPVWHEDREGLMVLWNHHKQFGLCAPYIKRRHPKSSYAWLYPKNLFCSYIMFLPLAIFMMLYIVMKIIVHDPRVIWYAPGILCGHMGYCWGIIRFFSEEKKKI